MNQLGITAGKKGLYPHFAHNWAQFYSPENYRRSFVCMDCGIRIEGFNEMKTCKRCNLHWAESSSGWIPEWDEYYRRIKEAN